MKFFELFRSFFKSAEPQGEIARENLFLGISRGLSDSIGRLPGPMVVILVIAASVSVLLGVFLQVMSARDKPVYLPLRIEINQTKPALNPQHLRGIWVYDDDVQTLTIRFGVDVFELIQAKKDIPNARYYVRGGFRVEGDVIILQQREDLGAPRDLNRLELKFIPLEMDVMNVRAEHSTGRQAGMMLWRMPQAERDRLLPSLQAELPLMDTRPMAFIQISKQ